MPQLSRASLDGAPPLHSSLCHASQLPLPGLARLRALNAPGLHLPLSITLNPPPPQGSLKPWACLGPLLPNEALWAL